MKYSVLFFLLVIAASSCDPGINDSGKRNENWAWILDDQGNGKWVPIGPQESAVTGQFTLFYSTGEIYETGFMIDGVRKDTASILDKSGDLLRYVIHESDTTSHSYYTRDGAYSETYPDGKINLVGTVKDHGQHGPWKRFTRDGILIWEADLVNNTGWEKNYFDSGMPKDCTNYINGVQDGIHLNWYANGQLQQKTIWSQGVQHGDQLYYHDNGQLSCTETRIAGRAEGDSKFYYANGNLQKEISIWRGQKSGVQKKYHENGKLQMEGTCEYGLQVGLWYWYDETGKLYQVDTYDQGKLIKADPK